MHTLFRSFVGNTWSSRETFSRLQCSQFNCSIVNERYYQLLCLNSFVQNRYFLISGHTFTILLLLMLLCFMCFSIDFMAWSKYIPVWNEFLPDKNPSVQVWNDSIPDWNRIIPDQTIIS